MQVEGDFNHQLHGYGMSLIHSRFELVLSHGLNGLLVQPHACMTNHVHILRIPLAVDDQLNRNCALKIGPARFRRELGIDGMNHDWRADAAPHAHHAAAESASATWTVSDSFPRTQSAAQAGAES